MLVTRPRPPLVRVLKRRSAASGLLAILLLMPLASCGSDRDPKANGEGQAGDEALRIIWQPGDLQPFYFANSKGMWSDYGLDPALIQVPQGTAALSALASGSADISLIGPGPTVSGISQGIDLVVVYSLVDFSSLEGLYVQAGSGIKSVEDLVGKRVAVPFGSSADTGLRFALEKAGISEDQVQLTNVAPPAILAGMASGEIEAAYIWSTWGQRLLADGAELAFTDSDAGVNAGPTLASVRREYLERNPDKVACFVATMDAAARGANKSPETAAQGLAEFAGVTPEQGLIIAESERSLTVEDALSPDGMFSLINTEDGLPWLLKAVGEQLKKQALTSNLPEDISNNISSAPAEAAQEIEPDGSCP